MSLISPPTMSDNECLPSLIVYIERLLLWAIPVLHKSTGANVMSATRFPARAAIVTGVAAALLGGCSSEPAGPATLSYEALQAKIGPDAVWTMTRAEYGKSYSRLGVKQFDNANVLMQWAAIAAAESDQCDHVEIVALSEKATRDELQWFVDCKNKARLQIVQAQAEDAKRRFDKTKAVPAQEQAR